jgi:hypothetical protein
MLDVNVECWQGSAMTMALSKRFKHWQACDQLTCYLIQQKEIEKNKSYNSDQENYFEFVML